eukprot:TRINITY_DN7788_c1_g1_i2.p1 TRINITY_DN7788_c1_g1~~TRINITY_DN7788_c1_g1_i2.p1  ORF type:complete len:620 (-),score=-0.27 TRINITY_DN7788_c1_g1_i2:585-2387(-)
MMPTRYQDFYVLDKQKRCSPVRLLQLVLFVLQLFLYCSCLQIPGCGELEDIKWNNQCFQSHVKQHRSVMIITNLIVYDRKVYLLVPPRANITKLQIHQQQLFNFLQEEYDINLVNVSYSPFMFGKKGQPYEIEKVINYDYGLLLLTGNSKRNMYQVWGGDPYWLDYVPSVTMYWMLCRYLGVCTFTNEVRDQILLMSTLYNQSHIDWDNGVNIQCFTANDILPVSRPSQYHARTLFMIRHVAIFSPQENRGKLNHSQHNSHSLDHSIKQQCIQQGYGYDSDNKLYDSKQYNISICARFKNEAKYLLEWIAHHVNMGIDHFVLYNDDSSDDYMEVLSPLIQSGLVTLYQRANLSLISEVGYHWVLMQHCSDYHQSQSKWLLSLDLDEFVVIKKENKYRTLWDWLDKNSVTKSDTGVVDLAREVLAGHHDPIKQSQLVIAEIFYQRKYFFGGSANNSKQGVKPLVSTNGLDRMKVHHAFTYASVVRNSLLEDKFNCTNSEDIAHNCDTLSDVSIYHYIVRSMEECKLKANQSVWNNYWRQHDGYQFCDSYVWGFEQDPANWMADYTLANPDVTKQTCIKMKELNDEWYTKQTLCGEYSSILK